MAIHNSKEPLIIITGAAGFIGSCMAQYLNENGIENLALVDNFFHSEKEPNWKNKKYKYAIEREEFFEWLHANKPSIEIIIHLGARTDTTEFDYTILHELNTEYSQDVWNYCTAYHIPLIYASSAATYGNGTLGYDDSHLMPDSLQPLNPYGISKNEFDKWALTQINFPPGWAGLKFFNVYGPNEYHKDRIASVIWHAYEQINKNGEVKLFKSHRPDFKDGEQLRDFIYVKDIVKVIFWMMKKMMNDEWPAPGNGIYNLGTGEARTFNALASATFAAMQLTPKITYIDMPADIQNTYQYFTCANMHKLAAAGYTAPFYSLEDGVKDYVHHYLSENKIW